MTTVVSVAQGGTGSNSAALARTALGVPPSAAYDQANTARDQANTARTQANTAYAQANSAYSDANTRLSASGGTLAGDLIITGNLTVSGNSTTLNAEILTIEDADVVLLSNVASTPALNAGIIVNRGTSTNTFLRWDEVTDKWGWSDDGSTTYKFTSALDAYAQANSAYGAANNRVLKAGDTMTGQLNISAGGLLVTGNVGVGMANPTHKLSVYGTVSETNPVFGLLSGKGSTTFNDGAQIAFGYNGSAQYMHFVHTRHNSSPANNSIDFYVSNGTQFNSPTSGSTHVMSLNGGNVGIGTTNPATTLHVNASGGGIVRVSRLGTGAGIMQMEADGTDGALSTTNNLRFQTASTERMRITLGGDLLVGATNADIGGSVPGIKLMGATGKILASTNTASGLFYDEPIYADRMDASGDGVCIALARNGFYKAGIGVIRGASASAQGSITIYTATNSGFNERMRIDSSGNVGVGTTSPGAKLHVSGGGIRIPANTWIDSETSVNLIRDGRFGYSDTYRVVQIGINSGTRAISLGYDPSVNLSGAFNGGEIIIPNNRAIIAPTSDNSTYIGVLRVDSANNLCIGGGNYQTSGYIFVNNTTGNVSIGTGTAGEKLSVNGAIESLVDAGGGASEGGQIVLRAPAGGNTRWNMDNYTNKFRIFREDDSNKANGAAFFHIINGGNVGIGTDNPSRRLHIVNGSSGANVDSTATQVVIENSADAGIHIMNPNGNIGRLMFGTPARMPAGLIRWDNTNNNFDFSTDKSGAYIRFLTDLFQERMRIVSGGAVGINFTNPAGYGQLTVGWSATDTTNNNGVGISVVPQADTSDAYYQIFFNATGGGIGSIRRVGTTSAVAFNTSSDRRLKENILPANSASTLIDSIQVVQYDWKEGTHVRHGIIAQDLYSVAPEAVSVGDAEEIDSPRNPWGVDYSKLVPMLIKEIQELRARIATLELGNN
jgi:hypothetical protein